MTSHLRAYRGGPPRGSVEADDALERAALDLVRHYWRRIAAGDDDALGTGVVPSRRAAIPAGNPSLRDLADHARALQLDAEPQADEIGSLRDPLTIAQELEFEAQRTSARSSRAQLDLLIEHALPLARWASSIAPNVRVQARFAILTAYDQVWTCRIRHHLADTPRPLVWWWKLGPYGSTQLNLQRSWPRPPGSAPPAIFPRDFSKLGRLPDVDLTRDTLAEDAWEGQRPFVRFLDPLRPPLAAVRVAGAIIREHAGSNFPTVVGVEMGHSFGAQALSVYLRGAKVWADSVLVTPDLVPGREPDVGRKYGRRKKFLEPQSADAVIVNIPDRVSEDCVKLVLHTEEPLLRADLDAMWARPRTELPAILDELATMAVRHLRPGGVLVVMGDVGSGATHVANEALHRTIKLEAIQVGGSAKPKVIVDTTEPWTPYGVVRPTGRLVSAWRRTA